MHNNNTIVPYISLCSGYEGIGLGLHRCIPNLRCIAYCEREAFAVSNVVAKMEKGLLDEAPVFTDVTTFPWQQFAPYMAGGILSFG
jgi:site-specific DNA-cytosine methylase